MAGKTHFQTPQGSGYEWADALHRYSFPNTVGNVFFVDSTKTGATNSAGYGRSPEAPFATLAYALGSTGPTTANNGDIVICCPGHTEAVIADGTITTNAAGVTILGIGSGRLRPVITYTTAAAASVNVTGANTRFENVVFKAVGVASVTAAVNVTAADVVFKACEFELANGTNQAVLGILTTAAADRLRVEACHFHGTVNAGTESAIKIVGGDSIVIMENIINGAFATTGGIQNATTAATNIHIFNNRILNQTADGNNKTIVLHASATGLLANNRGGIIDSTGPAPVTAAAAWVAGNYWSSAVGVTASVLM